MPSHRVFLGNVCGVTAASLVAGSAGLPALAFSGDASASVVGPMSPGERANKAYQFRHKAALDLKRMPLPAHPTNGDDEAYPNFIGNYSKGLPHNALGEVVPAAYVALKHALKTGDPADFDLVPAGGPVKQTHPRAAYCFELDGIDPHCLAVSARPLSPARARRPSCANSTGRRSRDIPFARYGSDPTIARAVKDLRQFSKFAGCDTSNIFRGETPGDLVGPYISQFLWKPYNFGAQPVTQRFRTTVPNSDFMTRYDEWLKIQNGGLPSGVQTFDSRLRHVRNGRDLTEWVHQDFTYQGFLVWYADPSRQAAAALSVKGAPTVYGVRQGKVEWELKGAKANPRMLKSILETWSEG
jgi:hypothetical protein